MENIILVIWYSETVIVVETKNALQHETVSDFSDSGLRLFFFCLFLHFVKACSHALTCVLGLHPDYVHLIMWAFFDNFFVQSSAGLKYWKKQIVAQSTKPVVQNLRLIDTPQILQDPYKCAFSDLIK